MSDGAQAQKFNILFDWFDQNHDGYVTQDDMRAMAGLFIVGVQGVSASRTRIPSGDGDGTARGQRASVRSGRAWGSAGAAGRRSRRR
jgi:hypothetical protein